MGDSTSHAGAPLPQRNPWHHLPFLNVGPGGTLRFQYGNKRHFGFSVHWEGQKSIPCDGGPGVCPHCQKSEFSWYAFACVWDLTSRKPGIISVPEVAYTNCPQVAGWEGQLLGKAGVMSRAPGKRTAGIMLALSDEIVITHLGELPPVESYIGRRYKIRLN